MDAMTVIALRALDHPLSGDHILSRLALSAAIELQVMASEQVFITMKGLILKGTDDRIIPDLVDAVDPAFQQGEDEEHQQDQQAGIESD